MSLLNFAEMQQQSILSVRDFSGNSKELNHPKHKKYYTVTVKSLYLTEQTQHGVKKAKRTLQLQ